ncbi:MAG: hypothetical protein IH614_09450 [Desulfuromonadales bacterium]|nr:hypothetical protein [Desulfuromonadales bacterium]
MTPLLRHVLLPLMAPTFFFVVAATPVEVLGCRNRGLLALLIVGVSLIGAVAATVAGTRGRARGRLGHRWWATTALILLLPAIALVFLA